MGLFYFWAHSHRMAENLSSPSIMILGRTQKGDPIMIDDFREAYWWLRDNTPEDSRVLSWWDYGYQINGIANRTTIADGNTWNHEHIALLGRSLVSSVKKSHRIVRHLADYVLVWSTRYGGMWGDDIAKSPHMARIGGSVYKSIKPDDFYQDEQGNPSPMMKRSLIFNAVNYRLDPNVPEFPPETYEEAYTSKNRMVRIYKVLRVSKKSRKYGKEGHGYRSWLAGRPLLSAYPPALQKILDEKEDFKQLEDFNRFVFLFLDLSLCFSLLLSFSLAVSVSGSLSLSHARIHRHPQTPTHIYSLRETHTHTYTSRQDFSGVS